MRKYNNKNIKLFSSLVLSLISVFCFSQAPTKKFHDTKGNIDVTGAGQLQYTLPIDLPPGIKNVAPGISLVYVSGGSNGLAGYGWNITGLSSISRVGKNLEKDGITKGVQLDYSDYYSFNGQRLILKSGEYGKDGAEYVTEKYSNFRIKSIGSITGQSWQGPEYWEVASPDGSMSWYGATASGNSSARTPIDYNIVKSKDTDGNYITYNYTLTDNVSVITKISWGGNELQGTQHLNAIDFNFMARPSDEIAYIKGIQFKPSKLLESVVVSTGNKQYKKYTISYKKDLQQTAYRYLEKITTLNGNNEEANPVTFTYEKSMDLPNGNIKTWKLDASIKPKEGEDLVGDFDGDGNLDLLRYHTTTTPKTPQIGLYLYSNFYRITYQDGAGDPLYIGNNITQLNFVGATVVNLKKNNLIRNRQGFVAKRFVLNPSTSKNDLELSFYGITDDNQLVLDFKKVIPNANYDYTIGTTQQGIRTTVTGIKSVDFNGDGLSELVLVFNDKTCQLDPIDKLPHSCKDTKRYMVVDPDESIQGSQWFYSLDLYSVLDNQDKDLFTVYKAGDFNGDGVFDFMKTDPLKKPLLITFSKNAQGKYVSAIAPFSQVTSEIVNGLWEDGVVGDYNGDGLSDIMIPQSNDSVNWYFYTSKGNGFAESIISFEQPQKDRKVIGFVDQDIWILNPKTFAAYDINNDGKAELIRLSSDRHYLKYYPQDSNVGVKYQRSIGSSVAAYSTTGGGGMPLNSDEEAYPDLTYLYLNDGNINNELALNAYDKVGLSVDQWTGSMLRRFMLVSMVPTVGYSTNFEQFVSYHDFYDISKEARIKSISQGGMTTDITYKQLDKSVNPGLYDGTQTVNYPYVEINQSTGMYVVSQLTQNTTSDKKLKQDFRYRGLTSNILGRGLIGFRKTARSSWYADGFENTKIWTGVETDPLSDGIPVKEWAIRTNTESNIFPADLSESNTQILSLKSTIYQTIKHLDGQQVTSVPEADKAKVVTAILPATTRVKDFLTGTVKEDNIIYEQYYLPLQIVSKVNDTYGVTTSVFAYDHNPSGIAAAYYIGRLKSKTETQQAYGDSQSGKEEYTYDSNRVKTLKKWNRNNTGNILETYSYDGFGNLTGKTLTNSIDSQVRTSKSQYDPTGRFVVKKTDNLGLETEFLYNSWGQVTSQTDPLGNILKNTYDNWGKLQTSENSLQGITSYIYERDSNDNVTVTKNDPDGNISKTFTNKLGQVYKATTKASVQGQFVSNETQYDILGRKLGESEPYFDGESASQWNTISYDDSVFPAKVKATAFTGKQTETSVSGFTTTVKETNTADYGRITSKTVDALGNATSSTDKGGTIKFSYNAAGEQVKAQYAENTVTTAYDVWGRKSEFNDPSNGLYKYEYDGFGQPKKTISPKGTKEYTYNNLGQLVLQKELSTNDGGTATNKNITFTYNTKGLLTKKSGTANGNPFSTEFGYDPQGRVVSAIENSNGKTYANKDINYDDKGREFSYLKQLSSSGMLTEVRIENVYDDWSGALFQIKDAQSDKVLWQLLKTNAKGQVLEARLGSSNINNSYNDATGMLSEIKHVSPVQTILNVQYGFNAIRNELKSRKTLGDFNIIESFDYDDNNRLLKWTNPVTGQLSDNTYDEKGRIKQNDQVGEIKFDNSAKIYQATGMTLNSIGVQNYNGDLIQTVVYNENNDPVQINGEKSRIAFEYGLGSMRQKVNISSLSQGTQNPTWENTYTKFYSEDGSFEVVKNLVTAKEKHILYVGGNPYESDIVYLKNFEESSGSYKFLHKDYLGSILAVCDQAGKRLEQRHYDAWGNLTHLKIGTSPITTDKSSIAGTSLLIDRGYTGHEHFFGVGIIHMNGRLYDPLLRRFLNADENIQNPTNTQNYNKYGYVMNNPLMYNDPDGEFWMMLAGAFIGGYFNGVAANNGNWNPVKWNWEKTWSAVLGGAIGGAAISGTFASITSNPGAIKFVLPGIVSGGLNSAFTGGNFLGGAVGGLSYSGNLFTNKVTSTDGISTAYKYIISPDYNEAGETEHYFQMAGFGQYGASGGVKPPFDKAEIGQLASAGIISAVTARILLGAVGAEIAGAGVIGAGGGITWSSITSTGTTILARTFALGLLLSVRGDSSGPPKAYVYTIMGREKVAKFGVTRAMDPDSRPSRQIPGLNRDYSSFGPHQWMYLHQGVSSNEAFLYEKYYVWQYFQNTGAMPYAQRYPKEDAVTKFLYQYLKLK
ncbi:RHS repeat-associated core domain-containing protein [Sphingobacterium siyangense]|nr:RHS repeat-associated core domain-containing protein [Sphingobacterium siyangense]